MSWRWWCLVLLAVAARADSIPASNGPAMFAAYCAVCHGRDGQGNGPVASALKTPPTDLTQLARKNGGKFPALKVFTVIQGDRLGGPHGSREMPIWGNLFRGLGSPETVTIRVANLAAYIESLQRK